MTQLFKAASIFLFLMAFNCIAYSQATVQVSNCPRTIAQTDLEVNNVRAHLLNGGDLWWDYNDPTRGIYEVPKGSGKNSIYAGAIWLGGIDDNGLIRVAAQSY